MGKLKLSHRYLEGFHISYTIPQIAKEFDLLRIEKNRVVNIELKTKATKERIYKQFLQNEYYLSFLTKDSYLFSYVKKTNKLYKLENKELIETDLAELRNILKINLDDILFKDINIFFNPSNYLVSPFNSTDKFLEGNYFLTNHQDYIKKIILRDILIKKYTYSYIEGSSGTGKSLLVYDIVKSLRKINKLYCIIHTGQLNNGHIKLIEKNWNIRKITDLEQVLNFKYDVLIIDESQRLEKEEVDKIIEYSERNKVNCIFSMDPKQTMEKTNTSEKNILEYIVKKIKDINPNYREGILTTNIRSNMEIEEFIKVLFNNKKHKKENTKFENIIVNYFNHLEEMLDYCKYLKDKRNCEAISYTTYSEKDPLSKLNIESEKSAHSIIGQEFENIYLNIDENFKYDHKGNLKYTSPGRRPYYNPIQMAYQIATRAKNKIYINILNNPSMYRYCLKILQE
ncbi:MAG: DNA/RNA helicase domain-containing protein [Miniphocaeibacter sp.]|uniref:DNA/RNA helicase domain-containing protein n=1 Tax=Miniphocaeibacter sp. TaxID=3100973 RepID=UPI00181EA3B8|nr:DUF2075 domain-containing protein [Gallicola sp.]